METSFFLVYSAGIFGTLYQISLKLKDGTELLNLLA